ncbi:MAG: hypothetical protein KJ970_00115 [Candidatus Eisenbacteria bacterium]|uniref:Peptidase A2 domain-containing protein n=1 Tax=Eiseniibacteriota bacterium TaxID=2212470 RepID=A0A948WAS1_UNCEI|nr:hypothetical protein [Candidatus Eisenbacteria bacterium]MBU1947824.1 hypothetical protein [Candidatus Eisenbacteria bacterium]MBU2689303.1 hypothetical protein [Candidatus Eisenbacteria bacterium]
MRRSRYLQCLLVCALFLPRPVEAEPPPDLRSQLDSLFGQTPSSPIEWVAKEGVSDRAAMKVPVKLDGDTCRFQVDTGLDVTLLYGNIPAKRGWETCDGMVHVPRMEIGGMDLGPVWVRTREDHGDPDKLGGSIGLDLLAGQLVIIDFPGNRIILMKHGQAPVWLWQRTTWTPAELRDAKLFLNITLNGKGLDGLLFDTGSSAFGLIVDFDRWKTLTECAGPEQAETEWIVGSWGRAMTILGAPALGALVIGSARIEDPNVFYIKEQPDLFSNWPFPANGLIGNALFFDRVVVLDLGIRPRFGLVQ